MKMKSQTITFLVAFIILLLTAGMMFLYSRQSQDSDPFAVAPPQDVSISVEEKYLTLPSEEKQAINTWIEENNLNTYGDKKDTVYIGGTPLFNEETGEYQERYNYLVDNYPDKPWLSERENEEPIEDDEENTQDSQDQEESNLNTEQAENVENEDSQSEEDSEEDETLSQEQAPMSFSEVEDWQTLVRTNYQMEYPDFTQLDSQEYPINITGDSNFEFTVYRRVEEPEGECKQAVNFGEDAIYLCHNQEELYQSVYQRMKDSFFVQ